MFLSKWSRFFFYFVLIDDISKYIMRPNYYVISYIDFLYHYHHSNVGVSQLWSKACGKARFSFQHL